MMFHGGPTERRDRVNASVSDAFVVLPEGILEHFGYNVIQRRGDVRKSIMYMTVDLHIGRDAVFRTAHFPSVDGEIELTYFSLRSSLLGVLSR